MSNASLASRLIKLCEAYERGEIAARELKVGVELHANSFEALEFADFKSLGEIATGLEIEAAFADEGSGNRAESQKLLEELRVIARRLALPNSPAPAPNPPKP